jgi:hypothetical protein
VLRAVQVGQYLSLGTSENGPQCVAMSFPRQRLVHHRTLNMTQAKRAMQTRRVRSKDVHPFFATARARPICSRKPAVSGDGTR